MFTLCAESSLSVSRMKTSMMSFTRSLRAHSNQGSRGRTQHKRDGLIHSFTICSLVHAGGRWRCDPWSRQVRPRGGCSLHTCPGVPSWSDQLGTRLGSQSKRSQLSHGAKGHATLEVDPSQRCSSEPNRWSLSSYGSGGLLILLVTF